MGWDPGKMNEDEIKRISDRIKKKYDKISKEEAESVPYNITVDFVSGRTAYFAEAKFFLPVGAMDDMVYIHEKNGATTYLMLQNVERLTYMEVEE